VQNLGQDVRYGVRTLLKNPGFTVVAVLTLALAIGANTAIFSVVENVLLRPLPYPQPEQLVEIFNTYFPQVPRGGLSPGDYSDWHDQNKSFSEMGAYAEVSTGFNLTGEGEPQRVQGAFVSSDLFPMLGVHPVAGRLFVVEENRAGSAPVVILSHHLWQSRFGADASVVGRSIALDNHRYTVIGVLPAGFPLLRWADLWMPVGQFNDDLTEHVHHAFTAVARLKAGVSLAQAREEIDALNRMETIAYPDAHKNFGVVVQPLVDPGAAKFRKTLLVLFGAVGLVLLIACANIVNLLLVRNAGRAREISVRTAMGASPWRLVRQLLTESSLLALVGGALGIALAFAGLQVLTAFVPSGDLIVLQQTHLNGWVLAFTLAVCLATGLLCGAIPALRTLRIDLAGVLKQGAKGSSSLGQNRTHNLLVISEIAMAIIPLIGAGLLLRSFQQLLTVDPGFRPQQLLTMEVQQPSVSFADYLKLTAEDQQRIGEKLSREFEEITTEIRALPGVQDAGGIDDLPLGTEFRQASRFVVEGQPILAAGARPIAQIRLASLRYFSVAGIPLRAGRTFNEDDWKVLHIVINEAMANRFWHGGDALGKRVNLCSLDPKPCWYEIVGIVGNVHQFGLEAEPTYDIYYVGGWTPYLVVRATGDPARLVPAVSDVVHKVDPDLPIARVITMEGLLSDSVSPRRFSAVLIGIFAALALLLAAVGIYGVVSYTVSGRTQEIGIRMAMGAQPGAVKAMILRESLRLTLIGVAAGLTGALLLVRFLASLLFGVSAYDVLTFAGVSLLLTGVALAASYIPARRAVRIDPLVALRYE